ncbi:MAG: recombinase family protein [Chloroflexi bacterium]|nr:recombinase family protein [Chloroflexota bacterium]MBU1749281.1 recombinase family protein [Chloroflexota bacterium]
MAGSRTKTRFDLERRLRDLSCKKPDQRNREVPGRPRAIIYARVSRVDQVDGLSLDAQIDRCREFAQSKNWEIVDELIEPGKSAFREDIDNRPALQQGLCKIIDGDADVLVGYSLDRLSRRMSVTVKIIELVARCGANLASATENLDYSTPEGRLFTYMIAIFSEYFSAAIAKHTTKVKLQRAIMGLHNGSLPFGYQRNSDGVAIPNADEAPAVIEAFESYATGMFSDRDIATHLNQKGYRTSGHWGHNAFSKDTVSAMLRNSFYAGIVKHKGQEYPGQHEPLISEELFRRVQKVRKSRRTR